MTFRPSETFTQLRAASWSIDDIARKQLLNDFTEHLEEEYDTDTSKLGQDAPTIGEWLGEKGNYYSIIRRYTSPWDYINVLHGAISGLFDLSEFARALEQHISRKHGEDNASHVVIRAAKLADDSDNEANLSFLYDPTYAWGD